MNEPKKTYTKGDVIVQEIKVGDIHYEFEYGQKATLKVLTLPKWDGKGWSWKSRCIEKGRTVRYYANHELPQYNPNLYTYEAYSVIEEKQ